MRLSAWAIRHPIPVILLFLALTIAGIVSYRNLPVKLYPDVSFPVVQVVVTQNGASPSELETQVTRLSEDAVASIPGVKHVLSTVTLGRSVTQVEFAIGEDEQKATDEVRTAIDRIRADYPRGIDEPIVERLEADGFPILTYAVSAPGMSETELSWFVEDTVARRLQGVAGLARVQRFGGVAREINVLLDPARLAARGMTAATVSEALRGFVADLPGGRAELGGAEQTVRILGGAADVAALRALTVPVAGGPSVRLGDVAEVGDGAAEARDFARLDGRPVVGFQLTKTKPASDVTVEDGVKAALNELARGGARFDLIVSTVEDTRQSFSATVHVLLEGMALAALVVFLFLRAWRSTVIAALAMPLSLIPTFAVMAVLGFSLNIVTLLGLTLVIGILVDDAIVEIENIEKRIAAGQEPFDAALEGADAIGLAVVATTMAIVVVFVPVSFMGGFAGQYFSEFGVTVAAAVLFSLLVARLLTPLLAAYFLKPARHPHHRPPFRGLYRRMLDGVLAHPGLATLGGAVFFAASLGLASLLPAGFVPAGNPSSVTITVQGDPGATRETMADAADRVTGLLKRQPDVAHAFASIGGETLTQGSVVAIFREDRETTASDFKTRLRPLLAGVADVRLSFEGESGAPAEVEVTLVGRDPAAVDAAALRLERDMRGVTQIAGVRAANPPAAPELVIRPRMEEAARLGVTAEVIAAVAGVATIGDVDANVAKLTADDRRLPIRAQLPDEARRDLAVLGALPVPIASGGYTRLDAVADLSFAAGPAQIDRFDRERRAAIRADLNGATLGQATDAITALPALRELPAGVRRAVYGEAENMDELFGGFIGAMLAGVGMIFAVLVLLFRSFLKPVTILTALPLSLGGAFAALLIVGLALDLPALIGLLMLLGLAAKNSILLVEFAIEAEREGMSRHDALIEACRERARPIVMTTVAMAAGMLPTALAIGEGAAFRQPMAVAVIGGLISSTALSLVLVPAVYELIERFEQRWAPRLAGLVNRPAAPHLPAAQFDPLIER